MNIAVNLVSITDDTTHAVAPKFGEIVLAAGIYALELTAFDQHTGDALELSSFNSHFKLHGDSCNGGLSITAVNTVPLPLAVDSPALVFSTSGEVPWLGQITTTRDGVDAAQSGFIGHSQDT